MSARQREWGKRVRAKILAELGFICAKCGATNELTLDCIEPRGHWHHRVDYSRRATFWRREHERGNLQVLCARCNSKKGDGHTTSENRSSDTNSPF